MTEAYACPICQKPAKAGDEHFPFCSRRCRLIDLGAWADGRYRICRPLTAADADPEDLEDGPPGPDGATPPGGPPGGSR